MKSLATLFIFIGIHFSGFAQQHISGSITHDGMQRDYILYEPANYTGTSPVPLVFNYHGWTSNATAQMNIANFELIADTAGFIIIHPQGSLFNGTTHWNVGGWTVGSTTDDVGFTEALLDTISMDYNIDSTRVYSTGYSNGGFMSFLLAGQFSEKIAAIASVAGSMTPETFNSSNPQHPTPILQIHGTTDIVVPYNGASFTHSIDNVLQYWINYNNCNPIPTTTVLPHNPNTTNGSTVEHIIYDSGVNGVAVEHFKVINGGHDWPGYNGNMDFSASEEIWNFFSKYDINGVVSSLDQDINEVQPYDFKLSQNYPNPFNPNTTIEFLIPKTEFVALNIYNLLGQEVATLVSENLKSGNHKYNWNASSFASGVYVYTLKAGSFQQVCKMIYLK